MKKTVTIGIPAHNEASNIESLLRSLIAQRGDNFVIESINVVCDGCTDNTAEIATAFSQKHPIVHCINDGKRMGQAGRLNEMYSKFSTDIFITFDGDVRLGDEKTVESLVSSFDDPTVGLVGGRVNVARQTTWIGKMLEAQHYFWSMVIDGFQNGQNLQSHTGPISAGSYKFLHTIKRPKDIIANDQYLYFAALQNGFSYRSNKNAYVIINVPTTFRDFMKQMTRFLDSADQIREYFGEWTSTSYAIPYQIKFKAYLKAIAKYPLSMPLAIGLVIVQKILAPLYAERATDGTWERVSSTK